MNEDIMVPEQEEAFRDKVSTIDESGKRVWIYPKKPKGKLYNARTILSIVFLHFIRCPLYKNQWRANVAFQCVRAQVCPFWAYFGPQDFHLFALAMLTFVLFIVLFTVVFGSDILWLGMSTDHFHGNGISQIEYWIEGDSSKQRKLNKAPWNAVKIRKKVSKHVIFFAIAFVIGNTFLAYIIGLDELKKIITSPLPSTLLVLWGCLSFRDILLCVRPL